MTTLNIEQGGQAVAIEQGAALVLDVGAPTLTITDCGATVQVGQPDSLAVSTEQVTLAVATEQVTIALDSIIGGNGVVLYDTEVELLAATLSDGTIAYARDTDHFWFRLGSVWHQRISADSDDEDITVDAAIIEGRLGVPVDVVGVAAADVRWNSSAEALEYYDGAAWHDSGSPKYILLKALVQAEATDLDLSAASWATSKALIETVRVMTLSTDWDLWLMQNDNGYTANDANVPRMQLMEAGNGDADIQLRQPYEDEDDSDEVHLYFVDNSGAATFDIYLMGSKLR